jgi:hypothetical protein
MRNHLDPRLFSATMLLTFRSLWLAHDWLLAPVLGSGKDAVPGWWGGKQGDRTKSD